MRRILVLPAAALCLLSGCAVVSRQTPAAPTMPVSCTTFAVQQGNQVLFGNNEDYENPVTLMWVVPSSEAGYGIDITPPTGPVFLAQFAVVGAAAMLALYLPHLLLIHPEVKLWR